MRIQCARCVSFTRSSRAKTPVIRKPICATATTRTCLSDRRSDIDAPIFTRDHRSPLRKCARLNHRWFARGPGCYRDQDNVNWWRFTYIWKYANAIESFFIELFVQDEPCWFLNMFSLIKINFFFINYRVYRSNSNIKIVFEYFIVNVTNKIIISINYFKVSDKNYMLKIFISNS